MPLHLVASASEGDDYDDDEDDASYDEDDEDYGCGENNNGLPACLSLLLASCLRVTETSPPKSADPGRSRVEIEASW